MVTMTTSHSCSALGQRAFMAKDMEPNYFEWLRKPVWSIVETLCLIARLDPACTSHNADLIVDVDTGQVIPADPDEALMHKAIRAAAEMQWRGIPDLIARAVKAGYLKATDASGEYLRSHELLAFLPLD
jgi:hypothetical protein